MCNISRFDKIDINKRLGGTIIQFNKLSACVLVKKDDGEWFGFTLKIELVGVIPSIDLASDYQHLNSMDVQFLAKQ